MLYYLEGKTYKEVGDILRLPTATVSTRIKRGKDKLKDVINEQLKGDMTMKEVI
jgi:DNA-directed RNA polymerase specialized sigma24 family protein